jgi:hypothetical protein
MGVGGGWRSCVVKVGGVWVELEVGCVWVALMFPVYGCRGCSCGGRVELAWMYVVYGCHVG